MGSCINGTYNFKHLCIIWFLLNLILVAYASEIERFLIIVIAYDIQAKNKENAL